QRRADIRAGSARLDRCRTRHLGWPPFGSEKAASSSTKAEARVANSQHNRYPDHQFGALCRMKREQINGWKIPTALVGKFQLEGGHRQSANSPKMAQSLTSLFCNRSWKFPYSYLESVSLSGPA